MLGKLFSEIFTNVSSISKYFTEKFEITSVNILLKSLTNISKYFTEKLNKNIFTSKQEYLHVKTRLSSRQNKNIFTSKQDYLHVKTRISSCQNKTIFTSKHNISLKSWTNISKYFTEMFELTFVNISLKSLPNISKYSTEMFELNYYFSSVCILAVKDIFWILMIYFKDVAY
jgi:hypothetical protein